MKTFSRFAAIAALIIPFASDANGAGSSASRDDLAAQRAAVREAADARLAAAREALAEQKAAALEAAAARLAAAREASDPEEEAEGSTPYWRSRPASAKPPATPAPAKTATAPAAAERPAAPAPAVAERAKPSGGSSGALSFGKPKAAAADLVTVEAKGQGESVEAAKKDAARNAIKKAVGELVDAKTLVENDELVEDKILTLSNAMIEKADYGDAKSVGDGLFEVPVTAVVKKGRLNQELKAVGIATGAVAGDSLSAAMFTGKERLANAEKFFAERLKGFPQNVMEAVMLTKEDGSPAVEVDPVSGHVYANVGVQVNMENYAEWTKQFQELLGQVCLDQKSVTLSFSKIGNGRLTSAGVSVQKLPRKKVFGDQFGDDPILPLYLLVCTPKKPDRLAWPSTLYYFDAKMWNVFVSQLERNCPNSAFIETSLKDGDDAPVCSGKWPPVGSFHRSAIWGNRCRLSHPFSPITGEFKEQHPNDMAFYGPAKPPVVAPSPGFCGETRDYNYLFEVRSIDENVADGVYKIRMDLGEVSAEDLAEVAGYEVKLVFE